MLSSVQNQITYNNYGRTVYIGLAIFVFGYLETRELTKFA